MPDPYEIPRVLVTGEDRERGDTLAGGDHLADDRGRNAGGTKPGERRRDLGRIERRQQCARGQQAQRVKSQRVTDHSNQ